jgi:3-oxoadipate enol-lactonase
MTQPRRMKTAGLTVNLRLKGSGPPLLFLGGSNFDLSIRAPVFDSALCTHFTVAAADPRGLGQTDAPDGDWTMDDYAGDAVHLLDALGWDRADVVGESFGAMTALALARRAPGRINRMALVAGAPGGDGGASYPIHKFLDIADPYERASAAARILDTRLAAQMQTDPDGADEVIRQRVAVEARFRANHDNERGFPRLLAARAGHDCWSALADIVIPTLVLAGEFDAQAPIDRAHNMVKTMPNAELAVFPSGHNLCFVSPAPVAFILGRWAA